MPRNLKPEEKIARRWLNKLNLVPPIDIDAVVNKFADIRTEDLPIDADAILVRKIESPDKAIVILSPTIHPNRRTFTLAHELGHILIPWHEGTFVCTPSDIDPYAEFIHRELETEANRFAAEFLIPEDYIQSLLRSEGTATKTVENICQNGISRIAASLKIIRSGPPGLIFAEINDVGTVIASGKSHGTFFDEPCRGQPLNTDLYEEVNSEIEISDGNSSKFVWIDTRKAKSDAPLEKDDRESSEILKDILKQCQDPVSMQRSIAGIVGAAFTSYKNSNGDIYTILTERFRGREHLSEALMHPKFPCFLRQKATELKSRW